MTFKGKGHMYMLYTKSLIKKLYFIVPASFKTDIYIKSYQFTRYIIQISYKKSIYRQFIVSLLPVYRQC